MFKKELTKSPDIFMKNYFILILLAFTGLVSSQNYEKNWEKVIALENENKLKSANEEVQKIYGKAKRRKDETQIIKTFFYTSKYLQALDEEAQTKIITNLKSEIKETSIPTQALLHYIYAKCLQSHLFKNKYNIQKFTSIDSAYTKDFRTWPVNILENEIKLAFDTSVKNEKILKDTPLLNYELIFNFIKYEDFKDASVYDFLATEGITYYTSQIDEERFRNEEDLNRKDIFFNTTSEFADSSFDFVKDPDLTNALGLYQKLERTSKHKQEHQFNRILFLKDLFQVSNDYFLKVLNRFQKNHLYNEMLQKVLYEKANIYQRNASKKEFPSYNILAIKTYDSILNLSRSNTYKKAVNAKNEINSRELQIHFLQQIYSKENTRAMVTYANTDNVTLSFYKIKHSFFKENDSRIKKDSLVNQFRKNNLPTKKVTYPLENKGDYFTYTTEILLPQLESGHYLVYMDSKQKNDSIKVRAYEYETLTVSNLALLSHITNNRIYYQSLDRKTGMPIEHVKIESADFTLYTDENGKADTKLPERNYYDNPILLSKDSDSLHIENNYVYQYRYDSDKDETLSAKVEFYLDRAIYRPGQIVYYKGIALWKKNNQTTVIPNLKVKLILEDANGDDIKEMVVTTNEFGSFSGQFALPQTGVTGEFTITAEEPDDVENDPLYDKKELEHPFWDNQEYGNGSSVSFKVEEYKRPKFEITFNPIKETYTVNQKISVSGSAMAFSGSAISNSKATYKIVRKSFENYRRYYHDELHTVAEGEVETDASGKFVIDFIAEPYERFKKESFPIFSYDISVSITDINGETRTNETTVKVGYHSLNLNVALPKIVESNKKEMLGLNSENLNNEFVPVKGELKFYFIGNVENKWKGKLWKEPELTNIDDNQFEQLFPYEKKSAKNSVEKLVYTKLVDTEKDRKIALDFMSYWKTGYYKVVFTAKDSFGNSMDTDSQFKLFQSRDKQKPSDELFTIKQLNANPKKDGYASVEITSNFGDLYLTANAFHNSINYDSKDIQLEKNKAVLRFPVKKEFKNNIKIHFETIFENQYSSKAFQVALIEENKPELLFEVENMRNKLEPGSNETWTFKIKGNSNNEAEVLASMYDSSLDQFTKKSWNQVAFPDNIRNYGLNQTPLGFERISTALRGLNDATKYYSINEIKTSLLWFGFNFADANDYYTKTMYNNLFEKNKGKIPSNAKSVTGIVNEGGLPLPGVSVVIKGTTRGTQTDMDGYYEIDVAYGEELVFSFIGMEDKTIKVNAKVHDVALKSQVKQLEEVVVGALGIKKKEQAIGYASQTVKEDSVYSAMLSGKIAGVQVTSPSGAPGSTSRIVLRGSSSITSSNEALIVVDGVIVNAASDLSKINADDILSTEILKGPAATALYGMKALNGVIVITTKKALQELKQVQARKNLNETAFFYPHLKTDKNGKIRFSFTSPEALTQWKLRLLGHNKKAVSGYFESTVITQKDLMIVPNFPRFLREKDTIYVSAKVSNLTTEAQTGIAVLQLFDATTMEPIDVRMNNTENIKNYKIASKGNTVITWKIVIPDGLQGVQYKVLGKSGNFSDGEENILPVLTNNMLVTESIPLWVREGTKKEYVLENLKANTSNTLRNHLITLEYTSNPTWLAIQSLPYLMEYEHECSEQTFARYYGNVLASEIINSNPNIAAVFDSWRKKGKPISKLEQNEDLKSILIAETPWIRDAQSEEERKKNLATLFDLDKMKQSLLTTLEKLKQKQKNSGGFAWFDGADESDYITRHILAGFGHLSKLKINSKVKDAFSQITKKGIIYIDRKFIESDKFQTDAKKRKGKLTLATGYSELHYLYTRSFYLESNPLTEELTKTVKLYLENINQNWVNYSLYEKGMAALTLHRFGEKDTAKKIIEGLKETASNNDQWGMYWIENKAGWYWYKAPIETQALIIEAFSEINNDTKSIDAMKIWLLKNKQNSNWPTTKATTEAIYALLMQGTDWLSVKENTVIKVGEEKVVTGKLSENEKEAQTGYIRLNWKADEINKDMATLSIENKSKVPGYGGFYWQYFEDIDKIKNGAVNNLSVSKELYLKKNTGEGEKLQRITKENQLKISDLVTIRITITAKEGMEFVHLKDMRAAAFEPVDVLSEYHWTGNLSYYQSTKDAATHFFFDKIKKGVYVLEYDVRVNNKGNFSNGITTIQSMYAPEFANHTKGIRISITDKP